MPALIDRISASDRDVLAVINGQFRDVLGPLLGPDVARAGVALLDFPNHQNVGDTMIWAGEVEHLRRLGAPVRYVTDMWRYDRATLDARAPGAVVLLHGGGNFGDVWPEFQQFREETVGALRDRTIVQLPQTIWFDDPAAAKRANAALSAHPDFTLLVRDRGSEARAAEQLPDVRTLWCPDAALGIGPLPSAASPEEFVMLLRGDKEVRPDRDAGLAGAKGTRVDWGLTGREYRIWTLSALPSKVNRLEGLRPRTYPLVAATYRRAAAMNMRAGNRTIGSARAVLTDRLHAHVLACLMGIPNVVLDNNYGKVKAIYDDYTHGFSTARFVETPGEAREAWAELTG